MAVNSEGGVYVLHFSVYIVDCSFFLLLLLYWDAHGVLSSTRNAWTGVEGFYAVDV